MLLLLLTARRRIWPACQTSDITMQTRNQAFQPAWQQQGLLQSIPACAQAEELLQQAPACAEQHYLAAAVGATLCGPMLPLWSLYSPLTGPTSATLPWLVLSCSAALKGTHLLHPASLNKSLLSSTSRAHVLQGGACNHCCLHTHVFRLAGLLLRGCCSKPLAGSSISVHMASAGLLPSRAAVILSPRCSA